jgi:hypothetical protein
VTRSQHTDWSRLTSNKILVDGLSHAISTSKEDRSRRANRIATWKALPTSRLLDLEDTACTVVDPIHYSGEGDSTEILHTKYKAIFIAPSIATSARV